MLTMQEIQNSKPSLETAKEILRQSELRITDTLNTSSGIESKAATFFGIFITISLFVIGFIIKTYEDMVGIHFVASLVLCTSLILSSCFFAMILKPTGYGILGTDIKNWLVPEIINDQTNESIAISMCYVSANYVKSEELNKSNNATKAQLLQWGMICALIAPISAIIMLLF